MTHSSSVDISLKEKKHSFITKTMLHNGIQNVKSNLRLMIVILVLHLAAVPMATAALMSEIAMRGDEDINSYLIIGFLTTGIAVAAGMVCVFSIFDYLYKKTEVDKRFSLPMTTMQRFVSDYLSGLFIYIVPFIISQVISGIMILAGHLIFDGKRIMINDSICTAFGDLYPYWWRLALGGLVIMLMFYTLAVLITSCCGSLFECIGYTLMVNAFIPFIGYIFTIIINDNVDGFTNNDLIMQWVSGFSPIGGVVGLIITLEQFDISGAASTVPVIINFGAWFLKFTLITLLLCPISYLIYRKRKAEDTGKPVVFRWVYHIVMFLAMTAIIFVFLLEMDSSEYIIPCILITGITYMILSVIRNRGFSHFLRSCISYVITVVSSVVLFIAASQSAYIPAAYVPDASLIDTAYISYNGCFINSTYCDFGDEYCSEEVTVITDPGQLEILTEAHRMQVRNKRNVYGTAGHDLRILYKLKSGKYVLRYYEWTYDDVRLKLSELDMTDTLKERRAKFISADTYINTEMTNGWYSSDEYDKLTVSPGFALHGYSAYDALSETIYYNELPKNFAEDIARCIYNDLMNESEEDYFRYSGNTYYVSYGTADFTLKDNYTETMNYLKACGITQFSKYSANSAWNILSSNGNNISLRSHKLDEYITESELVCHSGIIYTTDYNYKNELAYIDITDCSVLGKISFNDSEREAEDLAQIMNAAKPMYITDEDCYTIGADGRFNAAVIPYKYSEIAERLYIKAVFDTFISDQWYVSDYYAGINEGSGQYNNTIRYSYFLDAFLDCYDKDVIIDAYAYYTDKETAESMYEAISIFVDDTADCRR